MIERCVTFVVGGGGGGGEQHVQRPGRQSSRHLSLSWGFLLGIAVQGSAWPITLLSLLKNETPLSTNDGDAALRRSCLSKC